MQRRRAQPPPSSRGSTRPQTWTAVFALFVLVLVLMACGYHMGTSSAAAVFKRQESKLLAEIMNLRAEEAPCEAERKSMLSEFGTKVSSRAKQGYNTAQRKHKKTQDEFDMLENETQRCSDQLSSLTATFEMDLADAQGRRSTLMSLRAATYNMSSRLHTATHGDGPAAIAATQDALQLYEEYVQACSTSPGCIVDPLVLQTPEGESDDSAASADDAYMSELRPLDFDPRAQNLTGIFTVSENTLEDDDSARPTYFNRSDDAGAARVANAAPAHLRPQSLMSHYYTLVDAAFCAYKLHNSEVVVENRFMYDSRMELKGLLTRPQGLNGTRDSLESANTSRLHDLFETPLVRFCEGCDTSEWSSLCASYDSAASRHYGRHSYWAARSMVRTRTDTRVAASQFWRVREDAVVLAVVAQLQPTYTEECLAVTFNKSRGTHWAYLHVAFPPTSDAPDRDPLLQSHGRSRFAECSTSALDLVAAIVKAAELAVPKPTAIYLDVPRPLALGVLTALEQQSSPWAAKIIQRPDPTTAGAAADELLSHEIASRATHLLVSPYLATSRFVVENFLLRNNFSASTHVWYL